MINPGRTGHNEQSRKKVLQQLKNGHYINDMADVHKMTNKSIRRWRDQAVKRDKAAPKMWQIG
jgi:hypothetical protein